MPLGLILAVSAFLIAALAAGVWVRTARKREGRASPRASPEVPSGADSDLDLEKVAAVPEQEEPPNSDPEPPPNPSATSTAAGVYVSPWDVPASPPVNTTPHRLDRPWLDRLRPHRHPEAGSEEDAFAPGEWEQWQASQEEAGRILRQPDASKEPEVLKDDSFQVVDIYFGTDRSSYRPNDDNSGYAGGRAHRLRLGVSQVSVPAKRKPGSIPRPRKVLWFTLERPDPLFHFMIQETTALSEEDFTTRLSAAVRDQPGAGLLFVHGFNTKFDGALYRAAQLAVDLDVDGPMLLYSWPSSGSPLAYDFDSESVKQAREHFQAFMDVLSRTSMTRLNILAHSKGNELLLEMLGARSKSRLAHVHQVVLASPDVDCDFAQQIIGRTARKVKGMTLYACAKDIALGVSQQKAGGVPRAGDLLEDGYPLIVDGMDSIDASTSTLRLAEFNHNSFVADTVLRYDLARLLASGRRPPNDRSASITQEKCGRGVYWSLRAR